MVNQPLREPLHGIWTAPRRTLRRIIETDPGQSVLLLVVLSSLMSALASPGYGLLEGVLSTAPSSILTAILLNILEAVLLGLLFFYVLSFLSLRIGRWLGGKGTAARIRAAYAWALVPVVFGGLLLLPRLFFFGLEGLSGTPPYHADVPVVAFEVWHLSELLRGVLQIWSVVLAVHLLAEAHGFSSWRALATVIMSTTSLGLLYLGLMAASSIS